MFCAKDVCDILGYKNQRDAIQRHVEKVGVVKRDVKVSGSLRKDGTPTKRSQQMIFVNERDFSTLSIRILLNNLTRRFAPRNSYFSREENIELKIRKHSTLFSIQLFSFF